MFESGIELAIGESLRMADQVLTVLDIHGDEIIFRIDHVDEAADGFPTTGDSVLHLPPR